MTGKQRDREGKRKRRKEGERGKEERGDRRIESIRDYFTHLYLRAGGEWDKFVKVTIGKRQNVK